MTKIKTSTTSGNASAQNLNRHFRTTRPSITQRNSPRRPTGSSKPAGRQWLTRTPKPLPRNQSSKCKKKANSFIRLPNKSTALRIQMRSIIYWQLEEREIIRLMLLQVLWFPIRIPINKWNCRIRILYIWILTTKRFSSRIYTTPLKPDIAINPAT